MFHISSSEMEISSRGSQAGNISQSCSLIYAGGAKQGASEGGSSGASLSPRAEFRRKSCDMNMYIC